MGPRGRLFNCSVGPSFAIGYVAQSPGPDAPWRTEPRPRVSRRLRKSELDIGNDAFVLECGSLHYANRTQGDGDP